MSGALSIAAACCLPLSRLGQAISPAGCSAVLSWQQLSRPEESPSGERVVRPTPLLLLALSPPVGLRPPLLVPATPRGPVLRTLICHGYCDLFHELPLELGFVEAACSNLADMLAMFYPGHAGVN